MPGRCRWLLLGQVSEPVCSAFDKPAGEGCLRPTSTQQRPALRQSEEWKRCPKEWLPAVYQAPVKMPRSSRHPWMSIWFQPSPPNAWSKLLPAGSARRGWSPGSPRWLPQRLQRLLMQQQRMDFFVRLGCPGGPKHNETAFIFLYF